MTKRVYIIIIWTLCASLLSGCVGRSAAPEEPVPSAPPAAAATPEPPSTVPDPTTEPEKNGAYELLSGLFDNYHFGVAGSSLTGAWYAASLVDWGVKNGGEALISGARAWDRGLENEYGERMEDKLTSLYALAFSFYGQGKLVLADCGWEGEWDYSTAQIREVFEPIYASLSLDRPSLWRVYYPDSEVMYLRAQGVTLKSDDLVDITQSLNAALKDFVLRNGAAIHSAVLNNGVLTLELNRVLEEQIRAYGTSGELLTVAALVDTALDNVPGAESVMLTVNGAPLETGHNIYDRSMGFMEE